MRAYIFINLIIKRKITLVIKDPAFISQTNLEYLYYFANISLNILYKCSDENGSDEIGEKNNYCSIEGSRDDKFGIPVGIPRFDKSYGDISTPYLASNYFFSFFLYE